MLEVEIRTSKELAFPVAQSSPVGVHVSRIDAQYDEAVRFVTPDGAQESWARADALRRHSPVSATSSCFMRGLL
jgi:hypothetical protein